MRVSLQSFTLLLCALVLSPVARTLPVQDTAGEAIQPGMMAGSLFDAGVRAGAQVAAQQISPAKVYVHLAQRQQFTSVGATSWKATVGIITSAGQYIAPYVMPASNKVTVTATGPGGTAAAVVTLVGGALQAVSPSTVTLGLGKTQQFTSAGAVTWAADFGTVSSTGLYTAPAVWPRLGADRIYVNGPQGSGTASVTIPPPTPVITAVGNGGQIPLGLFDVSVQGTGLSSGSVAVIRGASVTTRLVGNELRITGFFNKPGPATVTVGNRTAIGAPFPVQIGLAKPKVSAAAARRFLEQAAFGPSPMEAERVQAMGFDAWITDQFNQPQISNYKNITATQGGLPEQFLTNAVNKQDQLRQKVAFALSQIFVTSLERLIWNKNMVQYQDMLLGDAFTNYRKIMADVTLSPAMGQYLDMANNAKADPTAGSVANENYARELMQLFTIGTYLLNPDGTLQLDSNNLPIPTYSQFTVTEFARVYTGWTYAPAPSKTVQWNSYISSFGPLAAYEAEHDEGSKQLLNGYVSPAGATAQQDLANAMLNIFNHPNIGPFVAKQLIKHLVKSNPSPAYVTRVAAAFKNGNGMRGDMKTVIRAILLDPEARANDEGGLDQPNDGHLQEPALFVVGLVRAFGGHMDDSNYYHWELAEQGQNIFDAPSVFNYYAPNTGVPGTALQGGEFQIYSPNNAVMRANLVSDLFSQWSDPVETFGPGTSVDVSAFVTLASSPQKLVDALDLTLTHGTMPAAMKATIETAVAGETGGNLRRVERACYLILTSSYYNVWH